MDDAANGEKPLFQDRPFRERFEGAELLLATIYARLAMFGGFVIALPVLILNAWFYALLPLPRMW